MAVRILSKKINLIVVHFLVSLLSINTQNYFNIIQYERNGSLLLSNLITYINTIIHYSTL